MRRIILGVVGLMLAVTRACSASRVERPGPGNSWEEE